MSRNNILDKMDIVMKTTAGRDKTCRFVQYFIKFLIPLIKIRKNQPNLIEKLKNLAGSMSTFRQIIRFFKPIICAHNFFRRLTSKN